MDLKNRRPFLFFALFYWTLELVWPKPKEIGNTTGMFCRFELFKKSIKEVVSKSRNINDVKTLLTTGGHLILENDISGFGKDFEKFLQNSKIRKIL